jgi:deazaflavin-dependent oxidoreductase (nitroreductase family)
MTSNAINRPSVPSIVPVLNPLIMRLLRMGVPLGPNLLVTVRGRRSGIPHTFPAAVVGAGDRRYLIATFGETNWVRNLRVAGEATIRHGPRQEVLRATELPLDRAAAALREGLAPSLRSRFMAPMLARWYGLGPSSSPSDFEQAAAAHPVFELTPVDARR